MLVNIHKLKPTLLLVLTLVIISPLQAQLWSLQQCIDTAQVKNRLLTARIAGIRPGMYRMMPSWRDELNGSQAQASSVKR